MLGRRRLRCAYRVRRREALLQTFLKLIVRCFIRLRRFFRVRRVPIEWCWIEFCARRSLPSKDQSFARLAVPFPKDVLLPSACSEDPSEANARFGLTGQLKERHAELL